MRWPRLPGAWSPRIPHSSAGFLESGKRLQRIAGRSARRRAAGVRSEGSQGRFRMACYLYFPATPLEFLCSVIHLIASYSVIKPLITSVSPSGHRISTPQPDPGFFRATNVGRCSDILRICAYGGPVQASYPATIKLTSYLDRVPCGTVRRAHQPPAVHRSRFSFRLPQCVSLRSELNTRSMPWFIARNMNMWANISQAVSRPKPASNLYGVLPVGQALGSS